MTHREGVRGDRRRGLPEGQKGKSKFAPGAFFVANFHPLPMGSASRVGVV